MSGKAIPMTQVASSLAPFVGRFTVDETGLAGRFDVELTWTPDQVSPNTSSDDARSDLPGPSIFTAIQEQLGLKLVPKRGPVDVLVVDRVKAPSGN
jgi:uncharacterized protein (TIGR03435 family)